jgi:hypothetical protein
MTNALHVKGFADFIKSFWGDTLLNAPVEEAGALERFSGITDKYPLEQDWQCVRNKKFLFWNERIGRNYAHQILFFIFLLREGRLGQGHVAMPWADSDRQDLTLPRRIESLWGRCGLDKRRFFQDLCRFGTSYYQAGPENLPLFPGFLDGKVDGDRLSQAYTNCFRDSYFSVVGEPHFGLTKIKRAAAFSKATFDAIMNRHPFLLLSEPGSLGILKDRGYKTFNNHFNESYDLIEDPAARLEALGKELSRLSGFNTKKWQSIYLDLQPTLEHNRQNLIQHVKDFGRNFLTALNG